MNRLKEMVKATLLRKKLSSGSKDDFELVGFRIVGHADYAGYGQDIVCAGASAIAQAAVLGLRDIKCEISFHKKSGYLEARISEKALGEGARAILKTVELGLLSLSKAYPGNINVDYHVVT